MDKLMELIKRCKCGVFVTVNEHRDYYQTAEKKLREIEDLDAEGFEDIPRDVKEKMVELNTVVEVHIYPKTPVGSYLIYHYDLETALDQALKCLD